MKNIIIWLFICTVTWQAHNMFLTACYSPGPYYDEYGIYHDNLITNAMACWETETKPMKKTFTNRDSAEKFVFNAPSNEDNLQAITSDWEIRCEGEEEVNKK